MLMSAAKLDINVTNKQETTPLSFAAEVGHTSMVAWLLDCGTIKPDLGEKDGRTPLWYAIQHGHVATVEMLLNTGKVDFNMPTKWDQHSPFAVAVGRGMTKVVDMMLASGRVVRVARISTVRQSLRGSQGRGDMKLLRKR
jgi:ankyrin repeat protein